MRRIPILKVNSSSTTGKPSSFEVELDYTDIFHGRGWITKSKVSSSLIGTKPEGAEDLIATTFEVVDSASHSGKYTVFTQSRPSQPASAVFKNGVTTIHVNELIKHESIGDLGYITNISSYRLKVEGEDDIVVLEKQHRSDRPVELVGRLSSGWGEDILQTQLRQAQTFAGQSSPSNPFLGNQWFDTKTKSLNVFDGTSWKSVAPERFIQLSPPSLDLGIVSVLRSPINLNITRVKASLAVPQQNGPVLMVNVKRNGLSIFGRQLTIRNGETTSITATPPEIVFPEISDDDVIEIEVSQLGDNSTATGLQVFLIGT